MSDNWQQNIVLIEVGIPGPAGTGFTALEASSVRNRLDALEANPVITTLESLTNVANSGALTGQTVIFGGTTWGFGNPNGSLTYVLDNWSGVGAIDDVTIITVGAGIKATPETASGGVRAHLALQYGGTGASDNVSREDHSHTQPIPYIYPVPVQGVLTAGTKTVTPSGAGLVGLDPAIIYDVDMMMILDVVKAGVDSKIAPRVKIGTGSTQGHDVTFNGNGKEIVVRGFATGVTGVTNYPLVATVQFTSGPQIELGAGQIMAIARPRR